MTAANSAKAKEVFSVAIAGPTFCRFEYGSHALSVTGGEEEGFHLNPIEFGWHVPTGWANAAMDARRCGESVVQVSVTVVVEFTAIVIGSSGCRQVGEITAEFIRNLRPILEDCGPQVFSEPTLPANGYDRVAVRVELYT
jgi:hypothetical protein